ncbi:sulfite exporter TauE/SafE family protein [Pseudobacteriovorax antillogorgiicola]|uniref:Probable membrane transporter protein n=1 Tax=Pseudobacteriovorax antillogorgiicola TaxID=1513793 RepID=A0A1Y6BQV4_9BACT|nr:sulfite exporter TauE/SafE family protein [Pseudobacteriovorax antillogorgiicola]TCS54707.1 hypothetical protein EDD56_106220 [Pseudobacteriovorax antillogorgiicola]SMF16245.1 hypothetical protein SAMN06296036_10623 [Pseudobacteriovorax antillogorgiicola]
MEILAYLSLLLVGMTLSIIGGGGSILTVPIFVYLFGLAADVSTSYSLFIVGLSAAVGAFQYYKEGLINFRVGATFAAPAFLGVFLVRRFVVPAIPDSVDLAIIELTKDQLILSVFAIIMLLASVSMLRGRKDPGIQQGDSKPPLNYPLIVAEGLLVGGVTGFVGAGGGFLIIPALVILAKLPMKEAVATSLMIITIKSLLGFTGDLGQIPIDWTFLLSSSAISVLGIIVGGRIAKLIPGEKLKKGFGVFVLIMGTFMILQQLAS